jgi:hypothetical protein
MPLMRDRMVCVMRASHAAAKTKMSMKTFLAARHLKVSMSPTDLRFMDDILANEAQPADVALNIPHWLVVPPVLERHRPACGDAASDLHRPWPASRWPSAICRLHRMPSIGRCTGIAGMTGNPAVAWLRAQARPRCQALG